MGLFSKEELEELGIEVPEEEEKVEIDPNAPREELIVYFVGDKPDTLWTYHHNEPDGKDYGRLEGYYDYDEETKQRTFTEHTSTNLKLMSYDEFMDHVPPNKDCTKTFNSRDELDEYLFLNAL